MRKKWWFRLALVCVLAIAIEFLVLNFAQTRDRLTQRYLEDVVYTAAEVELVNWQQDGDKLISQSDPQIILPEIDRYVNSLEIIFDTQVPINTVMVFYTDAQTPDFTGDAMIACPGEINGKCQITLQRNVNRLRIDIGDAEQQVIENLQIVQTHGNYRPYSLARIMSVILVYICGCFLMRLQKMPDYGLEKEGAANDDMPAVSVKEYQTTRYFTGIQLLHGICCLGILFTHAFASLEMHYSLEQGSSLNFFGRLGLLNLVLIFFAISGFFGARTVFEGSTTFLTFWKNRLLRVYPAYFATIIILVFLNSIVFGSYCVQSNIWKACTLLPFGVDNTVLGVVWTLMYEMMFYIIMSVFLFKPMKKFFLLGIAVWSAFLIPSFRTIGTCVLSFPDILLSRTNFAFVVGIAAYLIYRRFGKYLHQLSSKKSIAIFIICIVIFISDYIWVNVSVYVDILHYLLAGIIVLMSTNIVCKQRNALVGIGNASYGIYLIHMVFMDAFAFLLNKAQLPLGVGTYFLLTLPTLGFSVLFGWLDVKVISYVKRGFAYSRSLKSPASSGISK